MTGGRADRQIYLHRWQRGRRGTSHRPIPLSGPRGPRGRAGLGRKTLCRFGLLPEQGISLPPLGPCSEFSAGWDRSLSGPRLTHSHHISLSGGERDPAQERGGGEKKKNKPEKAAEGSHAGRHRDTGQSRRHRLPSSHLPSERVDEAGWLGSVSSRCGEAAAGRAASRATLFCHLLTLEPYREHYDSSGLRALHTDTKQV